jgi:hypothetical protein
MKIIVSIGIQIGAESSLGTVSTTAVASHGLSCEPEEG